jgi:hypothetical protein
MKSKKLTSSIFPSAAGNIYYYNRSEKTFFAVHPLFYYFDQFQKYMAPLNDIEIVEIRKRLMSENISFSKKDIKKIHTQYLFIKNMHAISKENINNYSYTELTDTSFVSKNFDATQQIIFEVTDTCNLNCPRWRGFVIRAAIYCLHVNNKEIA